jgi:hypothetical protein
MTEENDRGAVTYDGHPIWPGLCHVALPFSAADSTTSEEMKSRMDRRSSQTLIHTQPSQKNDAYELEIHFGLRMRIDLI